MKAGNMGKKKLRIGLAALMMTLTSFVSYGEETNAEDTWAARMELVQYVLDSGLLNTVLPSGGNQITLLPEEPVRIKTASVAGNVVYRDGNGEVLEMPGSAGGTGPAGGNGPAGGGNGSSAGNTGNGGDTSSQPSVEEVSISETYYDEYEIYCLDMAGKYFFYSSVGNRGITDKPVFVDIPANMNYIMLKDGVETPYTSKQILSENGSYVFYFKVVRNPSDPVSMQKFYEAEYNFRIQPKAKKPEASVQSTEGYSEDVKEESVNPYAEWQLTEEILTDVPEPGKEEETRAEGEATGEETETAGSTWELPKESGKEEEEGEEASLQPGGVTEYDYTAGMYRTSFGERLYLYASVPNGIMTNYGVTLDVSGVNGSLTILKDGIEYPLPEGQTLEDAGSYVLLVKDGEKTYTYGFRILGDAERALDMYTVPVGMELEAVYIDGISQNVNDFIDVSGTFRVNFKEDGRYRLVIRDSFGAVFDSELIRDSEPPVVTVEVTGKGAQISYKDRAEIESVILRSSDGEEVYSIVESVTKAGSYELEACDYAGNRTMVTFQVKRKLNKATIASILILIGILAGGLVFYIRTRKSSRDM